ncbi:hypothetical protein C8Q80DRAFT_1117271 [Daedaleopsis nitida]|nr:hypothetical protein C8Q80DRAFT_1117271 [Daedaleopsis nitida]
MWPVEVPECDILKEEHRRVVWSTVMLSAGHNSYKIASAHQDPSDMFVKDYRNLALLFPGDVLRHAGLTPVRSAQRYFGTQACTSEPFLSPVLRRGLSLRPTFGLRRTPSRQSLTAILAA